jgi:hypothetical protein
VTPVTGGVADAQKDRFVLAPRSFKGLIAPRIPLDWIVGVLQQIRAGFVYEMVRHVNRLHRFLGLEQSA